MPNDKTQDSAQQKISQTSQGQKSSVNDGNDPIDSLEDLIKKSQRRQKLRSQDEPQFQDNEAENEKSRIAELKKQKKQQTSARLKAQQAQLQQVITQSSQKEKNNASKQNNKDSEQEEQSSAIKQLSWKNIKKPVEE